MPPQKRPGRIAMEQQHRVSRPRPLVDTGAAALRRGNVARLVRPEAIEGPIHLSCWVCHISSTQASLLACDFLSWNPLLFLSRSYVVSTAAQIRLPNLDTGRFSRPGKVRRVSVPAGFQHVSFPGVASQTNQAGTSPLPARNSPTTLTCMLICRPSLACFTGVSLHRLLPHDAVRRRGRDAPKAQHTPSVTF